MSLSRLALRLALIETLAPYALNDAADPAWPTAAGPRVLDSALAPESFAEASERRLPLIAVFTDEAKTERHGTAPDALVDGYETVTLACEIMVPAVFQVDGEGSILAPAAGLDAVAEMTLDMVEAQILQRLDDGRMEGPLPCILDKVTGIESQPWRDADTDTRLSARRVEFTCEVRCSQRWPAPGASGLDRLPSPLRDVAQALPPESYGRKLCELVAEGLGDPAVFAALAEMRLAANLTRAASASPPPDPEPGETPPAGDLGGSVSLS